MPVGVPCGSCWLCHNSNHETAIRMHQFMLSRVSTVGAEAMAEMVSKELQAMEASHDSPDGASHGDGTNGDGPKPGTSKSDVLRHIQGGHLLNPSLQISHILRCLLEVRDTLHRMLFTEGEDGVRTVDARNMAVYLKVTSEIMQVYKTGDITKMLYYGEDK